MSSKNSTISKVGQRRQVVIPKKVFDELGLHEGDFVEVTRRGNGALIKRKKPVDPDDILTPEEAIIVRQGLAQARRGQTRAWRQIKNELDS
jgi:AbrB family looped-hinge helix DNA binding protein